MISKYGGHLKKLFNFNAYFKIYIYKQIDFFIISVIFF